MYGGVTLSDAPYHHGNLPEALLDAVEALLLKHGLEAVSIRACAKWVGVSHGAVFRHFRDKVALLTAFAARSGHRMADTIEKDVADAPPEERILAVKLSYVRFAIDNPGAFRSVFREDLIDAEDPAFREASDRLAAILTPQSPGDDDALVTPEILLAWAAVRGMSALYVDGALARGLPQNDPMGAIEAAFRKLTPMLQGRLGVGMDGKAFSHPQNGEFC